MVPYQYEPLPDPRAWLRVLCLSAGSEDTALQGSFKTVKVQDQTHYEALSYHWGPKEKPCKLHLTSEGHTYVLSITTNLDLALRRMRNDSQDRSIWADAICIDQTNDEEKEHQVRIMHKIYADATKVLVYLGETEKSLPQVIRLLQKIHRSPIEQLSDGRSTLKWIEENKLPSAIESWKWEPLKAFFRRPWFRRKWTIQECALASELVFHCGTWTCDWNWMSKVIATIYDAGLAVTDYTISINEEEAQKLQQGLSQINSIRLYKAARQGGKNLPFQDLAYQFQISEATDKRDHLFALLGMATDSDDKQLDPQYGFSTILQNCIRYANYFLYKDKTLEVLYRAGHTGHELLAPSWIPNWYGNHQAFGFEPNEGCWNPSLRPSHLHVARGTSLSITSSPNSVVLGLKGIVIDIIKDLANKNSGTTQDIWRNKKRMLAHRRQHLEASDEIMSQLKTYPSGQDLEDVQWRTLICNTTADGTIPDDGFRNAYEAWRRVTLSSPGTPASSTDLNNSKPFGRVVGSWNAAKVFGLTTAGLVGMFPYHARINDVVAVLYGGEFPFVLRSCTEPATANYELVGQCYVHGIMEEGQLDLRKWKHKEQEILLGGRFTKDKTTSESEEPVNRGE